MFSQSPDEKLCGSDVDPGCGAGDWGFEILCQSAVAIEPGESSLHNLSALKELKASNSGGACDDIDRPVAKFGHRLA